MVPPSYVRLFQITLSQTHSSKFKEHVGAASIDGTLHTPFQLMAGSDDQVAGSVDQVAESAAIATRFQVRLFNEDTRMAIDSKTSFLDSDAAMELVTQVRNYKGTKLWLFVMDRVQRMAADKWGSYVSPFQVRLGFEQIMDAALREDEELTDEFRICKRQRQEKARGQPTPAAAEGPQKEEETKLIEVNSEPEQELASPAEDRKGEGTSESREASPDWGEPVEYTNLHEALSELDHGEEVAESAAPVMNLIPPKDSKCHLSNQ
jgi:hypothetical protein